MGMGHWACFQSVMSEENIDKLTGGALTDLKEIIKNHNIKLWNVYMHYEMDDFNINIPDEEYEIFVSRVESAYQRVIETFSDVTGLGLELDYHDSANNGSRYDEIDGIFWVVSGVYQKTIAGKILGDKIQDVSYVVYG